MKKVFIGLGSNLDEPLLQLKKTVEHLKHLTTLNFINVSNFYSSPPMGPQDQPDFINAVVEITTSLSAEQLLDEL
ncbi:MAG: 2-amino-4-hydroxy-6-hydroxymethyldihydropteridine diphosphokinase, partial [Gammaproteobacteria bacterium]|nr:2-amino-4-hydroxy-6-hydroxymethyldihydropteridine diphosphokinase [Gammaproteobacteria bacterium]